MTQTIAPISPDLLEILRDPRAVQEPEKYGSDPGRLELVHGCWLVSNDTGYKYPIKDGIPVMLIEEGARWKDTAVENLPVPPPESEPPAEGSPLASMDPTYDTSSSNRFYMMIAAGLVLAIVSIVIFLRRRARSTGETLLIDSDLA